MTYQVSPFGNNVASGSGGNVTGNFVHNSYGQRNVGGNAGPLKTEGNGQELVLDIRGDMFASIGEQIGLTPIYLPAGAVIRKVVLQTKTAFTMTGTSPTVLIGTFGSEATNGVVISQSDADTLGYYDVTSTQTGTWAAATPLAAQTQVGMKLGGTSPTLSSVGEIRVTIQYDTIGTNTL
jgi:hypothetical protein